MTDYKKLRGKLSIESATSMAHQIEDILKTDPYFKKYKTAKVATDFKSSTGKKKYKSTLEQTEEFVIYWMPKVSKKGVERYNDIVTARSKISHGNVTLTQGSQALYGKYLSFPAPEEKQILEQDRKLRMNPDIEIIAKRILESVHKTYFKASGATKDYTSYARKDLFKKRTTQASLANLEYKYVMNDQELHFTDFSGSLYEWNYTQFLRALSRGSNNKITSNLVTEFINKLIRRGAWSMSILDIILSSKYRTAGGDLKTIWDIFVGGKTRGSDLDERTPGAEYTAEDIMDIMVDIVNQNGTSNMKNIIKKVRSEF